MEWSPPPDSPAAILDETEHLKRVAADLQAFEPPKRPQPVADTVSRRDLERAMDGLVQTIAKACKELVVAPLVKRIEELESRPVFDYTGTFKKGRTYRKGQGCTHDGSVFVALKD